MSSFENLLKDKNKTKNVELFIQMIHLFTLSQESAFLFLVIFILNAWLSYV